MLKQATAGAALASVGGRFPRRSLQGFGDPPRLRIAYLSCSGFQGNTTTANFVRGLFGMHDARHFEVHCVARGSGSFPGGVDGSPAQGQILEDCHRVWDHTRFSVSESAAQLHSLEVVVLIDLTGWTLFPCSEVLAMEPAPVQVQWHGYPGTMGAPFVHYIGADAIVSPPEHQADYVERMLYTPLSYLLNHHPFAHASALARPHLPILNLTSGEHIPPPSRSALGPYLRRLGSNLTSYRPDGGVREVEGFEESDVLLCSWNTPFKLDPHTLDAWLSALVRFPDARLWLMVFDGAAPPNIAREAEALGVDPARIVWSSFFPRQVEFQVKGLADLFLDTPSFNAHTTGVDALWAGTPLLTYPRDEFSSRVAASLVLGEGSAAATLTRNLEDYGATLHALIRHPSRLRTLGATLKEHRESPSSGQTGQMSSGQTGQMSGLWCVADWVRGPNPKY
ncbi:glycosyl transferase family 41-domain-containing protein [Baffinella frigidus]|nr:glycosyl transferase family 41-domain-containing protein [Cryptophyta sp. CCMP2293]